MIRVVIKFGSILLCVGLLRSQSIPAGNSQFFMTEVVRVKRQAGYVYNRPSVSFDLPPRAPPSPTPTQAPNVDRAPTQAQQMYYAYPAPAAAPGGSPLNPGATDGQQAGGTSGGYNYSPQTGGGQGVAPTGGGQGTAPNDQQSSTGGASPGYNYAPQNAGGQAGPGYTSRSAGGGSQGSGNAGYNYNAPATGAGSGFQASSTGAAQSSNSASAQASAGGSTRSGSGYSYQVSNPTLQPNLQTEVSTNAPKYLPPTDSAGGSADTGGSANAGAGYGGVQAPPPPSPLPITGGSGGYGAGETGQSAIPAPPTDQYLPPLPQTENTLQNPNVNAVVNTGSQTGSVSTGPSASYIPPAAGAGPLPQTENSLQNPNVNAATNAGSQTGSVPSGPSAAYIPPAAGAKPPPDVTPRPFAPPPPPPAGYLPPNENTDSASGQGSLSTPASTYLPPVL